MAALAITSPLPQFFDLDGTPLDAGRLYFGQVGQNPETAPVTVYWDEAATQPAAQPVPTSNGYVVRGSSTSGTPAFVYTTGAYSLTVRDCRGRQVLYVPDSSKISNDQTLLDLINGLRADLANPSDATKGAALMGWRDSKTVRDGLEMLTAAFVSVKDPRFGAKGDSNGTSGNGTDDTAAIQAAIDYVGSGGGSVYLPKSSGAYRITSGLKLPSYVTLVGPGAEGYPFNGGTNATYLMADFTNANQWVIEPKTTVGGGPVAYNAVISGGLPNGPTYNCAVRDLQIRVPSGAAVTPYGAIRMHGCPGSRVRDVSIVGTGCGLLVNQSYGGSYVAHTLTKYYGVAAWEDVNACNFDVYVTISDPAVNTVPAAYQLPFMTAFNGLLIPTYNLSTNAHYDRCWGVMLGASAGNTSSGNSVRVTVEGFSGGTFQIGSIATHFDRHYVEGAASDIEFACVAALSRFNASSFHAFDTSSGAIFDIGSDVTAEVSINGNLSSASFGTVYNSNTTMLDLKGCTAAGVGFTTPQVNVLFPDDAGPWTSPTLLNAWANAGGVDATVQYRKNNQTGNVELKGTLAGGAIGGNAFVLPAGFRPGARRQFAANSNNAHGALLVLATGDVLPAAGSNVGFALDGVQFKQEQ